MRVLSKVKWDVKITVIRKDKDFSIVTFDQVVGNLRTYEMNMNDLRKEKIFHDKSPALRVFDGEQSDLDEQQMTFLAKKSRSSF